MKCTAQTKAGARCSRPALRGSKLCVMHVPGRAALIGQRGGLRRRVFNPENLSQLAIPETAQDLAIFIATTIYETRLSRLDPRIANALGQLGGVFLKSLELGDLEKRVAELERKRGATNDVTNAS